MISWKRQCFDSPGGAYFWPLHQDCTVIASRECFRFQSMHNKLPINRARLSLLTHKDKDANH
jgi:hypothetical protein